ncbi:acetyltransferase [Mycena rosella]|uniref:Acetyltransferase n=1 Tax=Mycena rosella TaxID=1033263 RepID=A0AAD7GWX6_MYCRO|nr:acetyltransferase [Mycena rosella]
MHTQSTRLTLREFTLADIPALYELESIPEVARYQTWPPRTQADAERAVRDIIDDAKATPRVVVEQAVSIAPQETQRTTRSSDGTFIGRVGGIIDPAARTLEVWFSFMPSARGRGYATEATEALVGMLREAARDGDVPPFDRLVIECDPRNGRSIKLAERMGFVLQSCTEKAFECKGEWVGSMVYSRGLDVAT